MKCYKLLLKEVKQENNWGYQDKDAIKLGLVAFPFKGKIEDEEVEFKKGDEILFQYGTACKIDGEEYQLVSLNGVVGQK